MPASSRNSLRALRLLLPLLLLSGCNRANPPAPPPPPPAAPPAAKPPAGEDWNDGPVAWQPYEQGLATAAAEHKPVCLVFFTSWCPHCKNFSRVFKDPRVVEASRAFVMVRLDKDKAPAVSSKYAPDGEYIPRTYFLASNGTLDPDIHAPRPNFRYFYDEANPESVLAGMEEARRKLN